MKLENLKVQELSKDEKEKIQGGKVPMWLYIIAPGTAYLIEKFEKGCECNVL